MRGLLLTGLRDLVRRPLHTALMILGIAVGVAVVIAIDLANQSARIGFERSSDAVVGRATHAISGPSGVPSAILRRLRTEWGRPPSAPVVEGYVVAGEGRRRENIRVLGVDPFADAGFRSHLGSAAGSQAGFSVLVTEPGGVALARSLASRLDLELGEHFEVTVGDRRLTLRVVGLLSDEAGGAALDGLAIMDVGHAQELFGLGKLVSRIDLILSPEAAAVLAGQLPAGLTLATAGERVATAAQLSQAFQLNLTALSMLALLVGLFLIYNTVTFSVVQRRAVFATLRALGATDREVFLVVVAESLLTSVVGTVLGVGLGFLLGHGAVALVTRTINDFYYVLAVREVILEPASVLRGVALGLLTGVVAAVVPAIEAAGVPPAEALRPSRHETSSHRRLPFVTGGGVALSLIGGIVLWLFERPLVASFVGLFTLVMGLALTVPWLTLGLTRLLVRPLAWSLHGRIAVRSVGRSLGRTGVAIGALMVAISVTVGVGLMIGSFRATVDRWLGLSLVADVYVSAPSGAARRPGRLSPDVATRVAAVPGVASIETYRTTRVGSGFGEITLGVSDATRTRNAALYRTSGADPTAIWERVRNGAVVVSEPFAQRHRLPEAGAVVNVDTGRGRVAFPVAAVFYDYSTEEGVVLMSRGVYQRYFDDRDISSVAAYLTEGADAAEVASRIREALSDRSVFVSSTAALRTQALGVFDRTFAVTDALRLLAVVVAFIGVWSALMSLQLERTRELATLRALGMTPGEVRAMALLETGVMGLAAGVFSLPVGLLLSKILVDIINVRSFGWSMRLEIDPPLLAQAVLLSVAAALVAAVYPTWRLNRLPVASALRQE